MGLVVFAAIGLYLLVSIGVVTLAIRHAKNHAKSAMRWGGGAALAMFLLVFWDHIPTVLVHNYYCKKEAGFWIYKTIEQWKAENPGATESLVANTDGRSANGSYILNQRFNWRITKKGPLFLTRWRWEHEVVDSKTNDVLARYVDFSTGSGFIGGPPRLLKFWLQNDHCTGGELNYGRFLSVKRTFQGAGK